MKVDLHVHTEASYDSNSTFEEICESAKRKGIDKIAITDHNVIDNAIEYSKKRPDLFIVGEEIRSAKGDMIGLFLNKCIEPFMSPEDTIAAIHEQGGLVYIPHPFDAWRKGLGDYIYKIMDKVDIIEVFNSKAILNVNNDKALECAKEHNRLQGAGSDAHQASQIGNAYLEMPSFSNKEEFLEVLKKAKVYGQNTNPWRLLLSLKDLIIHTFKGK